jgi:FkbM family methyltransferase
MKKLFWQFYTFINSRLKYPNLRRGDVGIQCGFDMDAPVTSDLFLMCRKVKDTGFVYGIDPDPENHEIAQKIIQEKGLPIQTIQAALSNVAGQTTLLLGTKKGWSQLTNIPLDSTVEFSRKEITVQVKTLEQIIAENSIPFDRVRHINLTINGHEYHTLNGMKEMLKTADNLALTVIAGRYDETGTIDGKRDVDLILELLEECGFRTRFKRINELFWWGFVVKLLIQRTNIYKGNNYGVIFAVKGNCKIPWYQSFS